MAAQFLAHNVGDAPAIENVMLNKLAPLALALGVVTIAPAKADPYICVGAMTVVDVLFHVRQDAYFRNNPLAGKTMRVEYDGCGYRIHVGESSPNAHDGDVLLVDRYGRVTKVVHRRRQAESRSRDRRSE